MRKTLPISEVKARLPELVTGVEEREETVVVTRKGKPAAVLMNYAEYERLKETVDVLSDPTLMRHERSGDATPRVPGRPGSPGCRRRRRRRASGDGGSFRARREASPCARVACSPSVPDTAANSRWPSSPSAWHSPWRSRRGRGLAQPGGSSEQLTQSLVALGARYGAASPADQSRVLGYLLALAAARAQVLAGLMESDPGEVLRVTLPAGLRAALPPGVQALVEEEVEVDGTLEVLHADDVSGGRYLYHLATAGGRLSLHFAASPPELAAGTEVRARGVRLQRALTLDSGSSVVPVTSVPANTFGEQRVLVMPVGLELGHVRPHRFAAPAGRVLVTNVLS